MTHVSPAFLQAALPLLARAYGASEADLRPLALQLTQAWHLLEDSGEALGVLALRPSPAHGAEIMGGLFGSTPEGGVSLLRAALQVQPRLYAYAEPERFAAQVLEQAGFKPVSAYTSMSGRIPPLTPNIPDGFQLISLAEVASLEDRHAAQQTYSDMIGHTAVTPESIQPNTGGSDDRLGHLAYSQSGEPVGVCRVWREGQQISLTTPGIRPDCRASDLRRAMLLRVFEAARAAGAETVVLQSWGDTPRHRADDLALGLTLDAETPIYAADVQT